MTNAEAWFGIDLRPRKPEGSLGRTAQDGHIDSHTAPELCCPCVALHRYDQCVRTDRAGNSISLESVSVLNRSGDGDPTGRVFWDWATKWKDCTSSGTPKNMMQLEVKLHLTFTAKPQLIPQFLHYMT